MWSLEVEERTGGRDDSCVVTVIRDVCKVTQRGSTGFLVVGGWVDLTRLDEPPHGPSVTDVVGVYIRVDEIHTPDLWRLLCDLVTISEGRDWETVPDVLFSHLSSLTQP